MSNKQSESKALRDCLKNVLEMPVTDANLKRQLIVMGVEAEYMKNETLIALTLFNLAVKDKNLEAIKYIYERTGKKINLSD